LRFLYPLLLHLGQRINFAILVIRYQNTCSRETGARPQIGVDHSDPFESGYFEGERKPITLQLRTYVRNVYMMYTELNNRRIVLSCTTVDEKRMGRGKQ